ncbi:uncharacterized protein LOC144439112 [Glandiceps talaboti]
MSPTLPTTCTPANNVSSLPLYPVDKIGGSDISEMQHNTRRGGKRILTVERPTHVTNTGENIVQNIETDMDLPKLAPLPKLVLLNREEKKNPTVENQTRLQKLTNTEENSRQTNETDLNLPKLESLAWQSHLNSVMVKQETCYEESGTYVGFSSPASDENLTCTENEKYSSENITTDVCTLQPFQLTIVNNGAVQEGKCLKRTDVDLSGSVMVECSSDKSVCLLPGNIVMKQELNSETEVHENEEENGVSHLKTGIDSSATESADEGSEANYQCHDNVKFPANLTKTQGNTLNCLKIEIDSSATESSDEPGDEVCESKYECIDDLDSDSSLGYCDRKSDKDYNVENDDRNSTDTEFDSNFDSDSDSDSDSNTNEASPQSEIKTSKATMTEGEALDKLEVYKCKMTTTTHKRCPFKVKCTSTLKVVGSLSNLYQW